jgi:hypothetical protein
MFLHINIMLDAVHYFCQRCEQICCTRFFESWLCSRLQVWSLIMMTINHVQIAVQPAFDTSSGKLTMSNIVNIIKQHYYETNPDGSTPLIRNTPSRYTIHTQHISLRSILITFLIPSFSIKFRLKFLYRKP